MLRRSQNDGGGGVGLASDPGTVEGVGDEEERHHEDNEAGYLALDRVRRVRFLGFLCLRHIKELDIPHVRLKDCGDSYAREDTHHWGKN